MPRHGANIKQTSGGRWQASYRKPDGKEVSKTFDRRVDAARWRREGLAARDRGTYVDPKAGRVTVREYGERWRAAQLHHRPTTRREVETVLRLYVYPHIGALPIGHVGRSDVQALVKRWEADGAAPSTIRDARYKWLRALFGAAIKDDVIRRSPCTDISLPEVVEAKPVPLSAAEVSRLAEAIDPRFRAMVLVGYGCGVRVSEARGLTRPSVDFLGRQVAITAQLGPALPAGAAEELEALAIPGRAGARLRPGGAQRALAPLRRRRAGAAVLRRPWWAAPTTRAGSTTCGSASTTGSPISRLPSGSHSSRSSIACSRCGATLPPGTASCSQAWTKSKLRWPSTPIIAARGSSTSSRSPRALTGMRCSSGSAPRASRRRTTSRQFISSRTCASATASPRACARSPRTPARARSLSRSSPSSKQLTRS